MCPFGIVAVTPVVRDGTDLFPGGEDPTIKHLVAEGVVETLGIGIPVRPVRFNEHETDTPHRAPRPQDFGEEFRPIVIPQPPLCAMTGHQIVEPPRVWRRPGYVCAGTTGVPAGVAANCAS
jgi:hypothetical protein